MSLDLPEIRSSMSLENIEEVSSNENQNLDQTVLANKTIKEETLSYEIDVQSDNEKSTKHFFYGLKMNVSLIKSKNWKFPKIFVQD